MISLLAVNNTINYLSTLVFFMWRNYLSNFNFLYTYYLRNENIWNDGFLFDFLQKKTIDSWVRSYVIYTGFLFSERVVFEFIIRVYNDFIVWPLHNIFIYEPTNTSSMLNIILFIYFTLFIILVILYTMVL